jgi:SAM-dependent methyltransferase
MEGQATTIPLPDHSVDLVTSAQAAHWFDLPVFFRECQRVLKIGQGILAIAGYSFMRICNNERGAEILRELHASLAPYWPAGCDRVLLDSQFAGTPFDEYFDDVQRLHVPDRRRWRLSQLMGYLRTISALQEFAKSNPNEEQPADRVERLMKQDGVLPNGVDDTEIEVEIPFFIIMMRNKCI